MADIKVIDLSDVELHDENSSSQTEELQEYQLGQIVSVPDGDGVIAAYVEENFEYPAGAADRIERIEEEEDAEDVQMEEIEASPDNPVYIVALQDGGSVAVTADEIEGEGTLEGEGEDITEWPPEEGGDAELSPVYEYCDDPSDMAQLQEAKTKYIHENYASELADYVERSDTSLATLEQLSYEELVNIRGVDDPHVGFDELPPGWTRKSVLQAWASLGGMWRTCYPRMIRVRGPNFARRWCAALKDEVLMTEEWRGAF
jgi:hypothetical protein